VNKENTDLINQIVTNESSPRSVYFVLTGCVPFSSATGEFKKSYVVWLEETLHTAIKHLIELRKNA